MYIHTTSSSVFLLMDAGCFNILAIINNAAVNTVVHISFILFFLFFSGKNPIVIFTESYGSSIFSFLRNLHMFSVLSAPVYSLTHSAAEFPFLHTLDNTYYSLSFLMTAILSSVR